MKTTWPLPRDGQVSDVLPSLDSRRARQRLRRWLLSWCCNSVLQRKEPGHRRAPWHIVGKAADETGGVLLV